MALAPQVPERVLEREARMTQSRPLLGPVRWARTLVQKTLADFDLQPHRDRPALWLSSDSRMAEESHNATLLGPPVMGATHLAIARGVGTAESRSRTNPSWAAHMVQALQAVHPGEFSHLKVCNCPHSASMIDQSVYLHGD